MEINVNVDTSGLQAKTLREQKRLAYNVSNSLNNTAKDFQAQIRARITKEFKLRSESSQSRSFLLNQIVIKPFASPNKGIMYVEIGVAQKARLLLAAYETGEQRAGFVGQRAAIPNPATARQGGSFAGAIKPEDQFKRLKLKPVQVHAITRPDTTQYKGANRTFQLGSTAANPAGGVYQRVGPKPDDVRLLYSFRLAEKLKAILQFIETAEITMKDKFGVEWVIANARNPSV